MLCAPSLAEASKPEVPRWLSASFPFSPRTLDQPDDSLGLPTTDQDIYVWRNDLRPKSMEHLSQRAEASIDSFSEDTMLQWQKNTELPSKSFKEQLTHSMKAKVRTSSSLNYAEEGLVQREWTANKEKVLLGPYEYLNSQAGKNIRSQFISAFNLWLRVPQTSLDVITRVIKMLHTSSLLIDDVEDHSLLRRGIPVAHRIYGVPQTINAANYVYFQALFELSSLGNHDLVDIFTSELLNLHRGQGLELYWRDNLICPTEEEYLEMADYKTGGLFRLAVRLMQAESISPVDCAPLVTAIGRLFQILDDYLNLSPTGGYDALKGFCEDLTEGKFSFPAVHAIQADPSNHVLIGVLRLRSADEEVKKYALRYMEDIGSFKYSREVIEKLKCLVERLIGDVQSQFGLDKRGEEGAAAVRALVNQLNIR